MTDTRIETPSPTPAQASKSIRQTWLIIGGILSGMVLLLSLGLVGIWAWTVSSPQETKSHTETYQQAVADIKLDVEVGEVTLTAADGGGFQVRRDTTWRGTEPTVSESWTDADSFEAKTDCAKEFMFGIGSDECKVEYSMDVPGGTDADVSTEIADIDVDGLDGELRLGSSVGDIRAENLRTTRTVVTNDVGEVSLAFTEVLADITVETSVGDVTILVPDDGTTYDVSFDSSVGEQNLDIATDPASAADFQITVTTSIGDLTVRYV